MCEGSGENARMGGAPEPSLFAYIQVPLSYLLAKIVHICFMTMQGFERTIYD